MHLIWFGSFSGSHQNSVIRIPDQLLISVMVLYH